MRFEEVRRQRIRQGLSSAVVAQAVDRSLGWLYSIERGLTRPSRSDAEAIGALLRVPPDDLFTRIRDEEEHEVGEDRA